VLENEGFPLLRGESAESKLEATPDLTMVSMVQRSPAPFSNVR
jgi:hypothetical protein